MVLIVVLAFAGPRFRAGNNFLPDRRFLGVCFWAAICYLCSVLVPDFEGGANLGGIFLIVFSGQWFWIPSFAT